MINKKLKIDLLDIINCFITGKLSWRDYNEKSNQIENDHQLSKEEKYLADEIFFLIEEGLGHSGTSEDQGMGEYLIEYKKVEQEEFNKILVYKVLLESFSYLQETELINVGKKIQSGSGIASDEYYFKKIIEGELVKGKLHLHPDFSLRKKILTIVFVVIGVLILIIKRDSFF